MQTQDFDLLILDIGLPRHGRVRGIEHCAAPAVVPILILTARDSVQDRVAGLDGGADDYMAKPFSFDELLARVRRRIRTPAESTSSSLSSGEIRWT